MSFVISHRNKKDRFILWIKPSTWRNNNGLIFLNTALFEMRKMALAIKGVITVDIYLIEDNISILLVKHTNSINNIKRKWVLKIKYYLTSSFIF